MPGTMDSPKQPSLRLFVKGSFVCSADLMATGNINSCLKLIAMINLKWKLDMMEAERRYFAGITTLLEGRETFSNGWFYNVYELRLAGCSNGFEKLRAYVNSHVAIVKVCKEQLLLMTDNQITQRLGIKPFQRSDGQRLHCIHMSRDSNQQGEEPSSFQNKDEPLTSQCTSSADDPFVKNYNAWPPISSLLTRKKLSELFLKQYKNSLQIDTSSSCARTDCEFVGRKLLQADKCETQKSSCKAGKLERSETEADEHPERKRHKSELATDKKSPNNNKFRKPSKVKDKAENLQKSGKNSISTDLKTVPKARKSETLKKEQKKSKNSDKQRSTSMSNKSDKPTKLSKQQHADEGPSWIELLSNCQCQVFSSIFSGLTKGLGRIPKKRRPSSEEHVSSSQDTDKETKKGNAWKQEGSKIQSQYSQKLKHKCNKEHIKKSKDSKGKSNGKSEIPDLDITSERGDDVELLDSVKGSFKEGSYVRKMIRDSTSGLNRTTNKMAIPGLDDLAELNTLLKQKPEIAHVKRSVRITDNDMKVSVTGSIYRKGPSECKLDLQDLVKLALFGVSIPITEACSFQLYESILSVHTCQLSNCSRSVCKEVVKETKKSKYVVKVFYQRSSTFPGGKIHHKGAVKELVIPDLIATDLSSDDELSDISRMMEREKDQMPGHQERETFFGGNTREHYADAVTENKDVRTVKGDDVFKWKRDTPTPTSRLSTPKERWASIEGKECERKGESLVSKRQSKAEKKKKDKEEESLPKHRSRRSQSRDTCSRRSRSSSRQSHSRSRSRHSPSRDSRPKTPISGDKESGKENIGNRLQKIAASSNLGDPDKLAGRTEKRHDRQYHPYKKDDRPSRLHIPHWSFDLAYSDLNQLLLNMTENSFKRLKKRPAEVHSRNNNCGRKSYGNRGRFCHYKFKRADVTRTPPGDIYESSEEEDYIVHPDEIPDLKERAKQADALEKFMGNGEDEREFSTELMIYEKETNEDKRNVVIGKDYKLHSVVVIPGWSKNSAFSGQKLEDSNEESSDFSFLGNSRAYEDRDACKVTNEILQEEGQDMLTTSPKDINYDERKSEDKRDRPIEENNDLHSQLSVENSDQNKAEIDKSNETEQGKKKEHVSFEYNLDSGNDDESRKKAKQTEHRGILSSDSDVCLDWSDEDTALDKREVFKESINGPSNSDSVKTVVDECVQTPEISCSDGSVFKVCIVEGKKHRNETETNEHIVTYSDLDAVNNYSGTENLANKLQVSTETDCGKSTLTVAENEMKLNVLTETTHTNIEYTTRTSKDVNVNQHSDKALQKTNTDILAVNKREDYESKLHTVNANDAITAKKGHEKQINSRLSKDKSDTEDTVEIVRKIEAKSNIASSVLKDTGQIENQQENVVTVNVDEDMALGSQVEIVLDSCISAIEFQEVKLDKNECSKNLNEAEFIDEAGDRLVPDKTYLNNSGSKQEMSVGAAQIDRLNEKVPEKYEMIKQGDVLIAENNGKMMKTKGSVHYEGQVKRYSSEEKQFRTTGAVFEIAKTRECENITETIPSSDNMTKIREIVHSPLDVVGDTSDDVKSEEINKSALEISYDNKGLITGSSFVTSSGIERPDINIDEESTSSTWAYPLSEPGAECYQRSNGFISQLEDEAVFFVKDTTDEGTDEKANGDVNKKLESEMQIRCYSKTLDNIKDKYKEQVVEKPQNTHQNIENVQYSSYQSRNDGPASKFPYAGLPVPYFERPWFPLSMYHNTWPTVSAWQSAPVPYVLPYSSMYAPHESHMPVMHQEGSSQSSTPAFPWNEVPVSTPSPNYSAGARMYSPAFMNYILNNRRGAQEDSTSLQNDAQSAVSIAPWMISSDNMAPYMQNRNANTYFVTKHCIDIAGSTESGGNLDDKESFPVLDIPVHEIPLPVTAQKISIHDTISPQTSTCSNLCTSEDKYTNEALNIQKITSTHYSKHETDTDERKPAERDSTDVEKITVRERDSDKVKETDTDRVKETGTDKVKETGTDKVKETGTDMVKETDTDTVKETGTDKVKETDTDKVKKTDTDKVKEADTDKVKETATDKVKKTNKDRVKKTATDKVKKTDTDKVSNVRDSTILDINKSESNSQLKMNSPEQLKVLCSLRLEQLKNVNAVPLQRIEDKECEKFVNNIDRIKQAQNDSEQNLLKLRKTYCIDDSQSLVEKITRMWKEEGFLCSTENSFCTVRNLLSKKGVQIKDLNDCEKHCTEDCVFAPQDVIGANGSVNDVEKGRVIENYDTFLEMETPITEVTVPKSSQPDKIQNPNSLKKLCLKLLESFQKINFIPLNTLNNRHHSLDRDIHLVDASEHVELTKVGSGHSKQNLEVNIDTISNILDLPEKQITTVSKEVVNDKQNVLDFKQKYPKTDSVIRTEKKSTFKGVKSLDVDQMSRVQNPCNEFKAHLNLFYSDTEDNKSLDTKLKHALLQSEAGLMKRSSKVVNSILQLSEDCQFEDWKKVKGAEGECSDKGEDEFGNSEEQKYSPSPNSDNGKERASSDDKMCLPTSCSRQMQNVEYDKLHAIPYTTINNTDDESVSELSAFRKYLNRTEKGTEVKKPTHLKVHDTEVVQTDIREVSPETDCTTQMAFKSDSDRHGMKTLPTALSNTGNTMDCETTKLACFASFLKKDNLYDSYCIKSSEKVKDFTRKGKRMSNQNDKLLHVSGQESKHDEQELNLIAEKNERSNFESGKVMNIGDIQEIDNAPLPSGERSLKMPTSAACNYSEMKRLSQKSVDIAVYLKKRGIVIFSETVASKFTNGKEASDRVYNCDSYSQTKCSEIQDFERNESDVCLSDKVAKESELRYNDRKESDKNETNIQHFPQHSQNSKDVCCNIQPSAEVVAESLFGQTSKDSCIALKPNNFHNKHYRERNKLRYKASKQNYLRGLEADSMKSKMAYTNDWINQTRKQIQIEQGLPHRSLNDDKASIYKKSEINPGSVSERPWQVPCSEDSGLSGSKSTDDRSCKILSKANRFKSRIYRKHKVSSDSSSSSVSSERRNTETNHNSKRFPRAYRSFSSSSRSISSSLGHSEPYEGDRTLEMTRIRHKSESKRNRSYSSSRDSSTTSVSYRGRKPFSRYNRSTSYSSSSSSSSSSRGKYRNVESQSGRKRSDRFSSEKHQTRMFKSRERFRGRKSGYRTNLSDDYHCYRESRLSKFQTVGRFRNIFHTASSDISSSEISTESQVSTSGRSCNRTVGSPLRYENLTQAMENIIQQYAEGMCAQLEHCKKEIVPSVPLKIKKVLLKQDVLKKLQTAGLEKFLQALAAFSSQTCSWMIVLQASDVMDLNTDMQEDIEMLEKQHKNLIVVTDISCLDSFLMTELKNPDVAGIFVIIDPPDDEDIGSVIKYCSVTTFLDRYLTASIDTDSSQE